jgi:alkylation response protein AidB-like acyl-CoA dehydrogenase
LTNPSAFDPRRALTLRDVSEASGVSEMTVSRVLRNRGDVSEATREKVLQAARAFAYTVAKNLDLLGAEHVRQVRKDCASVILWTAEKATWMAGEGVQIFGGNGYINEYPLGRLWRDAKLYEIGAGTSEIRRMLIGRELFAETAGA